MDYGIVFSFHVFHQNIFKAKFCLPKFQTFMHFGILLDRVMVLDAGRIREFDSPQRLIAKHDSLFAKMAADSN